MFREPPREEIQNLLNALFEQEVKRIKTEAHLEKQRENERVGMSLSYRVGNIVPESTATIIAGISCDGCHRTNFIGKVS